MKYLPDKSDWSKYWVADIETNGLTPTKIWCICVENLETDEKYTFTEPEPSREFVNNNPGYWVGHNFLSFDAPVIKRLWNIPLLNICDTLVLDYLYSPKIKGGHSLEAVGERFGQPKLQHSDWTQFSPEMLKRCQTDVSITKRLYKNLISKMKEVGFSEESCEIEHRIREIVNDQERNGFCFNRRAAESFTHSLRAKQEELSKRVKELFPPTYEAVKTYKYREKADGTPFQSFVKHSNNYPKLSFNESKDEYTVLELKEFNIGSPQQRIKKLLSFGWEPTSFTKKGNPQVNEDELVKYANKISDDRIAAIADWLVLQGRASMVEGWLQASRKHADGLDYIHGRVGTCAASSRRMAHWEPNTANIPSEANGAKYGKEVREFWVARPDRKLVGIDAKSCQPRLLLHYLKAPEWLQDIYLKQDFHSYNKKNLTDGLGFEVVRGGGGAKTIYLAFIFGAKDTKLGKIVKKGPKVGTKIRKILYDTIPGMEKLQRDTSQWYNEYNGWLPCLDGGWVRCPSEHAAVNYLIQPAEAVVMKRSAMFIRSMLMENHLDTSTVLNAGFIHDEIIFDTAPEIAEKVASIGCKAIESAGKHFNLHVLMEGEAKIGSNWHLVH